jgi:hypothetical protein
MNNMRKAVAGCVLLAVAAGFAAAQAAGPGRGNPRDSGPGDRPNRFEEVAVTGQLGVDQGRIVLTDKDSSYYVMGLGQLIGFVEGLKEGASVTLAGYVFTSPRDQAVKVLQVSKLTLNGKDYEISRPRLAQTMPGYQGMNQKGMRQRMPAPPRSGCRW